LKKQNKFAVVVVGNVGIDTNIYPEGDTIDFDVEANFTTNHDYVGQAGGYASRGFARLGYKTAFIGHVGDDFCGHYILKTFAADNIDSSGIFIDPAGTARSVNFMYKDGRRKNFYDGKSHMTLKPDLEKCRKIISAAKVIHFNIPNWARHLLPVARELNKIISVDLQDIVNIDDEYRQDFMKYADVLFFSAVNFQNPHPIIQKIWQKYSNKIIISGMGKQGCALGKEGEIHYFPAIEFGGPVIDTNGAGDGLAVGFLSQYYLEDRSIAESINAAQIVARHTCSQKASTDNLITPEKLIKHLSDLA